MRRSSQYGSVLLETIAAMALLSISMMGIHLAFRQALMNHALAQDYATARQLLLRITSDRELQPELLEEGNSGVFESPFERFSYEYDVTRVDMPPLVFHSRMMQPDMRNVREALERRYVKYMGNLRVRITWTRAGNAFSIEGETLLAPKVLWLPPEEERRLQ